MTWAIPRLAPPGPYEISAFLTWPIDCWKYSYERVLVVSIVRNTRLRSSVSEAKLQSIAIGVYRGISFSRCLETGRSKHGNEHNSMENITSDWQVSHFQPSSHLHLGVDASRESVEHIEGPCHGDPSVSRGTPRVVLRSSNLKCSCRAGMPCNASI